MARKPINHQLHKEPFTIPNWEVKHLFIGTFNPSGGEKVDYNYGRPRNQFWKLLSEIFNTEFILNDKDFLNKLQENGILCLDLINSVEIDVELESSVIGKGYSDTKIINNKVSRVYNTENIQSVINKNRNIRVYSTWGKGSDIKDWKKEVEKLSNLIPLVSPSMAARVPKGSNKYNYMLADWNNKIII